MRNFLLVSLFSISNFLLFATHNRAGEIIYKQTGDKTIEATIFTYTKTSSLPADRDSIEICWGDNNCTFLLRTNDKGEELDNDYKVNYYKGSHTYSNGGKYTLSMTDPNRNSNVLNVGNSNSDLVQFHIESTLVLMDVSAATNHSPQLLEPPVDIGFIRQPFMHTPNAIDVDGDSIAYELITPLSAAGELVPNYKMVDEIGVSAENTYTFDEVTGLFIWTTPQSVGEYNIAYKIKAYRNGIVQDEIIRDMQILIMPEENLSPLIESDNLPTEVVEVTAGTTIEFSFTSYDPEESQSDVSPTISASSEILNQGATFTIKEMWGFNKGILDWTVREQDVRSLPYQVVFKSKDSNGAATYRLIQIKVKPLNVSTTQTFKELGYQLFPNPTADQFHITLPSTLQNQVVRLSIFDSTGKLVAIRNYEAEERIIRGTAKNLSKGNYILQLTSEDGLMASSILIKI